jgi:hypothetical protein
MVRTLQLFSLSWKRSKKKPVAILWILNFFLNMCRAYLPWPAGSIKYMNQFSIYDWKLKKKIQRRNFQSYRLLNKIRCSIFQRNHQSAISWITQELNSWSSILIIRTNIVWQICTQIFWLIFTINLCGFYENLCNLKKTTQILCEKGCNLCEIWVTQIGLDHTNKHRNFYCDGSPIPAKICVDDSLGKILFERKSLK